MPLTDNDLRAVLAERASATPGNDAVARVASVDRRVRVIRRRRAASASLAVVILLLVVTGVSGLFRDSRDRTAPVPAHPQKVAGGLLPRYNGGGKATAYTSFRTDEKRSTTFTFTPGSSGLLVAFRCDKDMAEGYLVSMQVNGKTLMMGTCSRALNTRGPSRGDEQNEADLFGIRPGEPASMRVRVVHIGSGATTPEEEPVYRGAMSNYRIAVGVYSTMALADYPLPRRPKTLESLDKDTNSGGGRMLGKVDSRSVGANGEGAVVTKLTNKGVQFEVYAVAPGAVTMTVNDRTVDVATFWTWEGSGYGSLVLRPDALQQLGIDVQVGDRITVGVAGKRFTDPAWRAELREGP
jgi:hypothetical protein